MCVLFGARKYCGVNVLPFSFPSTPFLKVTFQTPLRDPQTRKILSPTMTDKLETTFTLDFTEALADDLLSAPVSVE